MDDQNAVVRIFSRSNKAIGCGFLAAPGRILTCAHVIREAIGLHQTPTDKPSEDITLDFPLVEAGKKITARVVVWDAGLDIAGLELHGPAPAKATPAPFVYGSRLWGHPFQAFGFPVGYELGVWADGEMRGPNAAGWIQIDDSKKTGYFVQPGFSGGPIWDEKLQGIVGMVVQADRDPKVRSAFMIPMNLLFRAWPDLPEPTGILGAMHEVPAPPEKYLPRPEDVDAIKELLLGRPGQSTAILGKSLSVGLHGMGGIGKSVLAAACVHDYEVRRCFQDGIIWLPLGQEPNLTARQEDLAGHLGVIRTFKDLRQGRTQLHDLLRDKTCLIVLDDVWEYRHIIDAFDCLGANCRLLITTRNQGIVADLKAIPHTVNLLDELHSLQLLAEWAGQNLDNLPEEAIGIIQECGCLPLAIAMVGGMVQQTPESWGKVLRRLQNADLAKIQKQFPDYPYPNLLKAIQVSVDAIPETWRERYHDLAVFQEDTLISPVVLKTFWEPLGLDEDDVEDLIDELVKRSLARRDGQGRIFLHDLQHDYVHKQINDLPELHHRLVAAYRVKSESEQKLKGSEITLWTSRPSVDDYYISHIAYHLIMAQEWSELYEKLSDFNFIQARCQATSVYELLNDYRYALDQWKGLDNQRFNLEWFEERIRLDAGKIHIVPDLTFSILYNSLTWSDAPDGTIHNRCETNRSGKKNWLRNLHDPILNQSVTRQKIRENKCVISALAVTPDGREIVYGSTEGVLYTWDLQSDRLLHSLTGHKLSINWLVVSHDGRLIITGSADQTLKVWERQSGRLMFTLIGHTDGINSIAITYNNKFAVSGSSDNTIKIWDLANGRLIRSIKSKHGPINLVTIFPGNNCIVTASRDRTISIWEFESGRLLHEHKGHTGQIRALSVTSDGKRIITGGMDKLIKDWSFQQGPIVKSYIIEESNVSNIAISSDISNIIITSGDKLIIRDLKEPLTKIYELDFKSDISKIGVDSSGKMIALALNDGTLEVLNLVSMQTKHLSLKYSKAPSSAPITSVAITSDNLKVTSTSSDGIIQVSDLETLRLLLKKEIASFRSPGILISSNGHKIFYKTTERIQSLQEQLSTLKEPPKKKLIKGYRISYFAMSQQKYREDRKISREKLNRSKKKKLEEEIKRLRDQHMVEANILDINNANEPMSISANDEAFNSVTIAADNQTLISGSKDGLIHIWDMRSGQRLISFIAHSMEINAVALTPDERKVVSGSKDRTITVHDFISGQLLNTLVIHRGNIQKISVSPDGHNIYLGLSNGILGVWNLQNSDQFSQLSGHSSFVNDLESTKDGRWIISASDDKTIRLWDLYSGSSQILFWNDSPINCLALSKDERYLAAGDSAGRVWIFEWIH